MKKVIITKGLPASGKTTWARELQAKEPGVYKRINKDDIRSMLDNGKWSGPNEKFVLRVRDTLILLALESGYSVIVDDTNLNKIHEDRIADVLKQNRLKNGADTLIETRDFTTVPLEQCIEWDLKRTDSVGEKVIRKMYNQYLKPQPAWGVQPEGPNPALPEAIICDIDGTLALFGDKNPYERDFKNDKLNVPVARIVKQFPPSQVIYVSGREERNRAVTTDWLLVNGLPVKELYMRETADDRKDVIIKEEIWNGHIKDQYNVLFVLDDRNQTVDFWRGLGLTGLQVDYGDF